MPDKHRVLLTEASSASARQILTVLGRHGHDVGVMDAGGLSLTTGSRWVARRHRSPRFAADPLRYLEALRDVLTHTAYDVLLPTHEQLALLARYRDELTPLVGGLAVPDFDAVRKVQDKAAAVRVLDELGLPQPETVLARDERELLGATALLPAYVKLPVATASRGVWFAGDADQLSQVACLPSIRQALARGQDVLVQRSMTGEVVMVQALFDQGTLAASHTLLRCRAGVQGSASAKESIALPEIQPQLAKLGKALGWHGPLSLDAILDEDTGRPHYIDLNPRLVEPVNAELAGVDLVPRWLRISLGDDPGPVPVAAQGIRTHMLLMALLRHGETGAGRCAVLREFLHATTRRGWYADSEEELLPSRSDPGAAVALVLVGGALLVSPRMWRRFAGTGAPAHTITSEGWQQLLETEPG